MSTMKKAAPPRSDAKKSSPAKPAAGTTARPVAASARPPRPLNLPTQPPAAALRTPGPNETVSLAATVKQIDGRLKEIERAFDRARRAFGTASHARNVNTGKMWSPTGPRAHAQHEIDAHATEMRLLTVRRAELLWVRQLLVESGTAGR